MLWLVTVYTALPSHILKRISFAPQDTDFSKIHASGVSKILLKGQSYKAPPNMKGLVSFPFLD